MPQDGIRLVKGEVSILKLGELPIQLEGGTELGEVLSPSYSPPKSYLGPLQHVCHSHKWA